MKAAIATLAVLAATPALAHPGHYAESAGHSHWLAAGALALACLIAGAALWRGRRARQARKTRKTRKTAERRA